MHAAACWELCVWCVCVIWDGERRDKGDGWAPGAGAGKQRLVPEPSKVLFVTVTAVTLLAKLTPPRQSVPVLFVDVRLVKVTCVLL